MLLKAREHEEEISKPNFKICADTKIVIFRLKTLKQLYHP